MIMANKSKNGKNILLTLSYPFFTAPDHPFFSAFFNLLERNAAIYKIDVNFKNSDGWRVRPPMDSQREAPKKLLPKKGIKTPTNSTKLKNKRTGEAFFKNSRGILKTISAATNPTAMRMSWRYR